MNQEKSNCAKISVDCAYNDPVDVRCGGAEILGYDFFVKKENADEIIEYIKNVLNNLNVPFMGVYVDDYLMLAEKDIWSKERIFDAIIKQAEYIKSEASRNYKPSSRRK